MGKPITIEQSHTAISILANNVDWSSLDTETLQWVINNPKIAGAHFTAFLKNGGRIIIGEPKVIPIDRSKPFDPVAFLGEGWKIEEQDERSLALTEVNLADVEFKTMLEGRETLVKGETKLERLKKTGNIRLDAKVLQTLWENQILIPERWKEQTNGNTTHVFFDGTVLRNPSGGRVVLCLYWIGGRWDWGLDWLSCVWGGSNSSAVLAS